MSVSPRPTRASIGLRFAASSRQRASDHPGRHGGGRLRLAARPGRLQRPASSGWSPVPPLTCCAPAGCRAATRTAPCAVRWPPSRCPRSRRWIIDSYFVEGGIAPDAPFRQVPRHTLTSSQRLVELTVAANFVEVFLAKEGHDGLVGVNYLRKIELPLPAALYGAMLAGVDYVLVGAGSPADIPELVRLLSEHRPVTLAVRVQGARSADGDRPGPVRPGRCLGTGTPVPVCASPTSWRSSPPVTWRATWPTDSADPPGRLRRRGSPGRRAQRSATRTPPAGRAGPAGLRRPRRGRHRQPARSRPAGVARRLVRHPASGTARPGGWVRPASRWAPLSPTATSRVSRPR